MRLVISTIGIGSTYSLLAKWATVVKWRTSAILLYSVVLRTPVHVPALVPIRKATWLSAGQTSLTPFRLCADNFNARRTPHHHVAIQSKETGSRRFYQRPCGPRPHQTQGVRAVRARSVWPPRYHPGFAALFWKYLGLKTDYCLCEYSQALRYIIRNTTLPQRARAQAQLQLSQMHAYTRPTQIKNRCVAGGIARSIFRDFRIARVSVPCSWTACDGGLWPLGL